MSLDVNLNPDAAAGEFVDGEIVHSEFSIPIGLNRNSFANS
jgi:hypothetical protein